jgi:hypothetical protein
MTYVYDPRYVIDSSAFTYYPPLYDRTLTHIWRSDSGHAAITLIPKTEPTGTKEMTNNWATFPNLPVRSEETDSETWYWLLKPGHDLLPEFERRLEYSTHRDYWAQNEPWELNAKYEFRNYDPANKECNWVALTLMPPVTNEDTKTITSSRFATKVAPFDIFYLSYNEPYADENYTNLKKRFPKARRIHNIKGIFNAHTIAAKMADSLMFYVVDADAIITEGFDFSFVPNQYEYDVTHVWRARNPINGLEYGYGGVKLFPTKALRDATSWNIDFTTSVGTGFKGLEQVSNITQFNSDPFNTWKSAFRECVKLASKIIKNQDNSETEQRLLVWRTVKNDAPFADYCISGAKAGTEYGIQFKDDPEALNKINDFEWLEAEFRKHNE